MGLGTIGLALTRLAAARQGGISQGRQQQYERGQQGISNAFKQRQLDIAQQQADSAKPKRFAPVVGPNGDVFVIDTETGQLVKGGANVGAKGSNKTALTPNEQRAARQAARALREMKRLYAADPSSAETPVSSAALRGIGTLPIVGGIAKGLTDPAAQRALSKNQQAFQRAATTLRHHYAMISPHARISLGLLHDVNTALVPPAGTDAATVADSFAPEWDYTLSQIEPIAGAGPDTGGLETPAASHAPQGATQPQAPTGGSIVPKRFHPGP